MCSDVVIYSFYWISWFCCYFQTRRIPKILLIHELIHQLSSRVIIFLPKLAIEALLINGSFTTCFMCCNWWSLIRFTQSIPCYRRTLVMVFLEQKKHAISIVAYLEFENLWGLVFLLWKLELLSNLKFLKIDLSLLLGQKVSSRQQNKD